MAFCIFLGKQPSFFPASVRTTMPYYEKCWEAVDAATCLHHLQALSPQIDVSTAFGKLRDCRKDEQIMLEISDFGMFTLVFGKMR